MIGAGNGTFLPPAGGNPSTGFFTTGVVLADFNNDGKLDAATANNSSANVNVFFGDGTGRLTSNATYFIGDNPYSLTAADFNGDGRIDIATANNANSVTILTNGISGAFTATQTLSPGLHPVAILAADVNNDGRFDLATANIDAASVSVFLAGGPFGSATTALLQTTPSAVVTADFNNDSRADVVSLLSGVTRIQLGLGEGLLGLQRRSFPATPPPLPAISTPTGRWISPARSSTVGSASRLATATAPSPRSRWSPFPQRLRHRHRRFQQRR